jgi:hypothetical protein
VQPCFVLAPVGDLALPTTINTTDSPLCSTDVMDVPVGLCVNARGHDRTRAVASFATALADAVLAGDHERARALAEELQGAPGALAV